MTENEEHSTPDQLICRNCGIGFMETAHQDGEPEYTENYQCSNCGHTAIIPSAVIISSQLFTGLLGASTSLYLLLEELYKILEAFQISTVINMASSLLLLLLATFFFLGFIYTFYRAIKGIGLRRLYRRRDSRPMNSGTKSDKETPPL